MEQIVHRAQTGLAFDTTAARTFGVLKATLEHRGTPPAEPDLRIASIALSRGLILVTRKVRLYAVDSEPWWGRCIGRSGDSPWAASIGAAVRSAGWGRQIAVVKGGACAIVPATPCGGTLDAGEPPQDDRGDCEGTEIPVSTS